MLDPPKHLTVLMLTHQQQIDMMIKIHLNHEIERTVMLQVTLVAMIEIHQDQVVVMIRI